MNFLLPEDGSVQPRMLLDLDVPDSDVVYLAEADVIADIDYYSSSVISAYKTPVKSIPFRLSILIWLLF